MNAGRGSGFFLVSNLFKGFNLLPPAAAVLLVVLGLNNSSASSSKFSNSSNPVPPYLPPTGESFFVSLVAKVYGLESSAGFEKGSSFLTSGRLVMGSGYFFVISSGCFFVIGSGYCFLVSGKLVIGSGYFLAIGSGIVFWLGLVWGLVSKPPSSSSKPLLPVLNLLAALLEYVGLSSILFTFYSS